MNIYPHIPYTYLIGWTIYNRWYYGVRFANNCNPVDLWNTYFTSSKIVKQFRKEYGEPDVIQVRKCFYNKEDAINWELKTLKRITNKNCFINKTFGTVKGYDCTGRIVSKETRKKISIARQKHKGGHRKPHTEETKNKLREKAIGRKMSNETRAKMSESRIGKKHSDETRAKMSQIIKSHEWQSKINDALKKPKELKCCRIRDKKEMPVSSLARWP